MAQLETASGGARTSRAAGGSAGLGRGLAKWALGLALLGAGAPAIASSIPVFRTSGVGPSTLSGAHDADGTGPVDFTSAMALPAGPATLIAPFDGAGHSIASIPNNWSTI